MRPVAIVSGVLACVLVIVVTVIAVVAAQRPTPARDDGLAPAQVARNTPLPQPDPLPAGTDVDAWAAVNADRTGIPARALRAYAAAEIAQRKATPRCRLSWVTIAGRFPEGAAGEGNRGVTTVMTYRRGRGSALSTQPARSRRPAGSGG